MALELLSALCTFENSTECSKFHSILILFRIAIKSIAGFCQHNYLMCTCAYSIREITA